MSRFGLGFIGGGNNGNDGFTKVLLHMDGAAGGLVFPDDNANGSVRTWTPSSASTYQPVKKFGTASLLCSGAGYLYTPDHADFAFGSQDFTIDFWFNGNSVSGVNAICGHENAAGTLADSAFRIIKNSIDQITFTVMSGASSWQVGTALTFNNSAWHHIACEREGNTIREFVNGVHQGSIAISGALNNPTGGFAIGRLGDATATPFLNGLVDEFRLSVGVARYPGTTTFAVPTAPYS